MTGLAFAGAAILYDTSIDVGRWVPLPSAAVLLWNVLHHYPQDRYVGAAPALFASVALLFWYVLMIFISSRD